MSTRRSQRGREEEEERANDDSEDLKLLQTKKRRMNERKRTRSNSRAKKNSNFGEEDDEEDNEEEDDNGKKEKSVKQKSILKTRNTDNDGQRRRKRKDYKDASTEEEEEFEEEEEGGGRDGPSVDLIERKNKKTTAVAQKKTTKKKKEKESAEEEEGADDDEDEEEDVGKSTPPQTKKNNKQSNVANNAVLLAKPKGRFEEDEEDDDDEADDEEEQTLFDWLVAKKEKNEEQKATRLAAEWTSRYQTDKASAGAEIYTLLAKASGCKAKIYSPELQNSECAVILSRVEQELRQGNVDPDDPMSEKGKVYKHFKNNLTLFMKALIRETIDSEDLFDDTLFEMFREIFQTCSGSSARVVRVVATEMGLTSISGLVNTCLSQKRQSALKQRQLDNALASNRAAAKTEAAAIQKTMDECSKNIEACTGMIKEMFNGVFTQRFRDYDAQIRANCMAALSTWMLDYPLMFLTDFYLKYMGWSMNDKSPLVRLEVLRGLRRLYEDETNASIMDGFTNRFSVRIQQLLFDIDPSVVCEAIFVVAQLRENETYDSSAMNDILHLITDESESVRLSAAKVLPTMFPALLDTYYKTRSKKRTTTTTKKSKLSKTKVNTKRNLKMKDDDEEREEEEGDEEEEDEGILLDDDIDDDGDFETELGVGDLTASETLESVLELVKILSNTTHAKHLRDSDALETHSKIIDAVWEEMPLFHSFEFLAQKLCDDAFCSDPSDAVALANLTLRAVKKSQMENIIADAISKTKVPTPAKMSMTKRDIESCNQSLEKITLAFTKHLPTLLTKYSVEDNVLAPLIQIIPYMKLEHYPLRQRLDEFESMLESVKDIYFKRVDTKVLDSTARTIAFCANDGYEGIRSSASKVLESVAKQLGDKLSQLLPKLLKSKKDDDDDDDDDIIDEASGEALILKCCLARVQALLKHTKLPKLRGEAVFDAMATILDAVSRNFVREGDEKVLKDIKVGPISAGFLAEAVMYEVVWRGTDLSEQEQAKEDDVTSFQSTRDRALTSLIRLAENAEKIFGNYGSKNVVETRRMCTAAIADAVIYLKMAAETSVSLSPSMMTAAWRAADKIMTPEDENLDADENASKIGYQLALVDSKCGDYASGSVAAPAFIANFAIGGDHLDAAIKGFMTELRRESTTKLARTIFLALADAYQVVSNATKSGNDGSDNAQRAIDFLRDLATRIASIFSASVQRDRLVVRHMAADCVNYALVPLQPEKFAFLEYAVSAFIPKISQVDAKNVLDACEEQLKKADEADARTLSLQEFVEVVRIRSLGKSAAKAERIKREKKMEEEEEEEEESFEEEDEIETDSELRGATPASNKTRKTNKSTTPGSEKKRTLEAKATTKKNVVVVPKFAEKKKAVVATTTTTEEEDDTTMDDAEEGKEEKKEKDEDIIPLQKPSRRGRR